MPRRKRRRDDPDASVRVTNSKQGRKEKDDALTVADSGFQLIKRLGLNDQVWQPAATILDSLRLYSEVVRIRITEGPGGIAVTSQDALHIGRVFLLCDVAGISNILSDCTTSVELRLHFNEYKLLVSVATPSRPVVLVHFCAKNLSSYTLLSTQLHVVV